MPSCFDNLLSQIWHFIKIILGKGDFVVVEKTHCCSAIAAEVPGVDEKLCIQLLGLIDDEFFAHNSTLVGVYLRLCSPGHNFVFSRIIVPYKKGMDIGKGILKLVWLNS